MNQQEILKKIGGIIAELKDQYTYLQAAENGLNELELELFMANANFLTDHIGILQKINQQLISPALPAAKPVLQLEETPQKPPVPDYFDEKDLLYLEEARLQFNYIEPENVDLPPAETKPNPETIILPEIMPAADSEGVVEADASFMPINLTTFPEGNNEKDLTDDASFTPINSATFPEGNNEKDVTDDASFIAPELLPEPEAIFEPVKEAPEKYAFVLQEAGFLKVEKSEPVAEVFPPENTQPKTAQPEPVLTLNERIAAQKGLDQPKAKTTSKNVQDLQSMISLNDKLLFVKELFNGYNLAYSEAVTILNRYTGFEQAEAFLNQNYTVKNNWKEKPQTVEKFMDLLRNRFA